MPLVRSLVCKKQKNKVIKKLSHIFGHFNRKDECVKQTNSIETAYTTRVDYASRSENQ